MRKFAAAAVLMLGLLALLGAGRGGTYTGGTYAGAGASYQAGGVAAVDTTRIIVRDFLYPNTAARTAGYVSAADTVGAIVNQGTRGQAVRWGHVRKNTATTVYYDASAPYQSYYVAFANARSEDDFTWQADAFLGFVAINTNVMQPGDKIEKFDLIVNVAAFESYIVPAGEYVACRLDTIAADQAMVTSSIVGYAADTDTARMDISWNEVDATGNIAWSPTLDSRTDRHDFGPRSNNVIGPATYAAGTPLKFDMRDAVQIESDRGNVGTGKWLIFMVYGSSGQTDLPFFSAGDYGSWVGASQGKGCPTAVIRTSSRRGARAWNGTAPVPVAIVFDDQYPVQSSYFTEIEAAGEQFDIAAYRNAVNAYTWVDSLYALKPNLFGLVHHSRTHASLGTLTAAQIHPELARGWYLDEFTGFTAADTLGIIDCAWPAGGSSPNAGILAASMMVDYGYRASRGYGTSWTAADVGLEYETWPSWSGWFNAYNYRPIAISGVMGAASIADKIGDYVDLAYTDHAKSALIFYGHRNTTAPADGITPAKLTEMIGVIDAANSCEIMPLETIMGMRLNGATFGTPQAASAGARLIATTDSVTIRKTAAVMDSLYRADADPNLLEMWAAPK